jgi:hypothetical protein
MFDYKTVTVNNNDDDDVGDDSDNFKSYLFTCQLSPMDSHKVGTSKEKKTQSTK